MSLDYNLAKCKDVEEITIGEEWPVTQGIIFGCMSTGIGKLTTDTEINEFYARYSLLAKIHGYNTYTRAQIARRKGLRTNVFPNEPRASWMKRIIGRVLDEYARA